MRFEPASWEELVDAIEDGSPEALARLGRSPMALKHYWDETREIKTKVFVSMIDNLYARIFNLPTERDPDGRQRAIVPPDFQEKETIVWKPNVRNVGTAAGHDAHCRLMVQVIFLLLSIVLKTPQDYPYWYEPGIEHHCIWCSRPLPEERIKQVCVERRHGGIHRGVSHNAAWKS